MLLEPDNIYCVDCREGLGLLEDESIPLTITSPPYDGLREYGGHKWDFGVFVQIANELWRVTRKGGIVIWVVGDSTIKGSESGTSFRQALYFKEIGFRLHDTMIYEKAGPAYPDQTRYYNTFEYMFVFSKGKPETFNPIRDRKNRWYGQKWSNTRSRRNKKGELKVTAWDAAEGEEFGTRFNIWRYAVGYGNSGPKEMNKDHPAVFPEQLAIDHVLSWSNEGDLVLDPMIGSGTVGVACVKTGRHYIGFEVEESYCVVATKRIEAE
jgi:site-specific DNA-methyltransferase (adenine-specific)